MPSDDSNKQRIFKETVELMKAGRYITFIAKESGGPDQMICLGVPVDQHIHFIVGWLEGLKKDFINSDSERGEGHFINECSHLISHLLSIAFDDDYEDHIRAEKGVSLEDLLSMFKKGKDGKNNGI